MAGSGEDPLDAAALDEADDQERLPTLAGHPDAGEEDTILPPGPVAPPPPSAPMDAMDGSTKLDPSPLPPQEAPPLAANPFAGLLAEAQGKPSKKKAAPSTLVMRERTHADSPAPKELDEADTIDQSAPLAHRKVGPYRILDEIGSGGMAVVHKASQPALDRLVAIKELRAEYMHDRQIATRFEREATSMATLQHGNIVHVHDFIRAKDAAFIVMEHVDGIDLFDVLADSATLPADVAAICALQVTEGLEYAHYRGIVHRDIKPSNVLISRRGEVKIMDFGIARDPGKSELTQVGLAVGTPAYMAPEQIRGDRIDFRTDIFAVGIVLYEMLAGSKPWPEESGRSVTVKVLDEPPVPLLKVCPAAPPELVRIVERCLNKDPEARYASTFELRRDLQRYVQNALFMDPRGRLVLFLKNRGFVKPTEARTFVDAEMMNDPLTARRDAGIPPPPPQLLFKPLAIAHAVAFAIILLTGLISIWLPFGEVLAKAPTSPPPAPPAAASAPEPPAGGPGAPRLAASAPTAAMQGPTGSLRVVVDPWARVLVDGRYHDTTPFAAPIKLAPGTHRVSLRNPYCEPSDRIIEVSEGQTVDLKVALIPRALDGRRRAR